MKLRKNICRRCSVALAFAAILWCSCVASALTLDECQQLAAGNYPLLKRYDLIRATTDYTVSNASKGYLPQITVGAQATLQSDVMALPDAMNAMLAASGAEVKGLKKDQYRVSVDVNQVSTMVEISSRQSKWQKLRAKCAAAGMMWKSMPFATV